jgi:hypothetical protein
MDPYCPPATGGSVWIEFGQSIRRLPRGGMWLRHTVQLHCTPNGHCSQQGFRSGIAHSAIRLSAKPLREATASNERLLPGGPPDPATGCWPIPDDIVATDNARLIMRTNGWLLNSLFSQAEFGYRPAE